MARKSQITVTSRADAAKTQIAGELLHFLGVLNADGECRLLGVEAVELDALLGIQAALFGLCAVIDLFDALVEVRALLTEFL